MRAEADAEAFIAAAIETLAINSHTITVIGAKGGVGTTTLALLTGLLLAEVPGARPVVVELANDWGATKLLLGEANPRSAADLLTHCTAAHTAGVGFIQGFMTLWGRLPVLTAPSDPRMIPQLTPTDYEAVLRLLRAHYNLVLLDCGSSFAHPLARFALDAAHHVLLVSDPDPVAMYRAHTAIAHLAREVPFGDATQPIARSSTICRYPRAPADLTMALNRSDAASVFACSDPAWKEVMPHLNATLCLPPSEPLRRRFATGTLSAETVPTETRRALKMLLAAMLGRLAYP